MMRTILNNESSFMPSLLFNTSLAGLLFWLLFAGISN
jgi:hypothetical protein